MIRPNLAAAILMVASTFAAAGVNIAYLADIEPANNDGGGTGVVLPCSTCSSAASAVCSLTSGDTDNFLINLLVGDELSVMTTPLAALPLHMNTPDTMIEIYNPLNLLVTANDDAGAGSPPGGFGSVIRHRVTTAGIHRIRILGLSASDGGDYVLTIGRRTAGVSQFDEGTNGTIADATTLLLRDGPLMVHANATAGGFDYFAVDMSTGDVLSVMTSPITSATVPDTILAILDTDGTTVLVQNDDASFGQGSRGSCVRFRAPASGRYFIRQTLFSGALPGPYHLIASLVPAPFCPGDANGDRYVTFADITAVLANFNAACR